MRPVLGPASPRHRRLQLLTWGLGPWVVVVVVVVAGAVLVLPSGWFEAAGRVRRRWLPFPQLPATWAPTEQAWTEKTSAPLALSAAEMRLMHLGELRSASILSIMW